MSVLLPACPALVADPDVAELLADLEAAGITSTVVVTPSYVEGCGCCPEREPGDLDAGRVFDSVADVHHRFGGMADYWTPACAPVSAEVDYWVRRGRTVTVTAYGSAS